jgi:8-oxo-dGTP pyrophosphatase MutT (NUDIX family)
MPLIKREDLKHMVEVHVSGVCLRSENGGKTRALIAKRNEDRELYPGKWESCGGQLRVGESFVDGIERHYKEEMSITVIPLDYCSIYSIPMADGGVIPGIRFLCLYLEGEVSSENHSEIHWSTYDELMAMDEEDFVPGLRQVILDWIDR